LKINGEFILNSSKSSFYPHLLISEERATPQHGTSLLQSQPFIPGSAMHPLDRFSVNMIREQGIWANALTIEQTAYALGQVSAPVVLPPLVELDNGNALLEYRVSLRNCLDSQHVSELVNVLETSGQELFWGQIEAHVYAAVIRAGVAACIDTTPEHETLYFRYAQTLENKLNNVYRAAELPLSLFALQTVLYERFDALLNQIRLRTWHWLIG
jgi:hypothetical protein